MTVASGPPGVELSDDDLVRRVGDGDEAACGTLVRRHLGRIVAFGARVLGDATEAEDVAQETFLRLWTHAAEWEPGRAAVSTWLHRVALNLCLDRRRKRPTEALDDVPEPVDPAPQPSEAVQQQDLSGHVQRELLQLTASQRIALALCHYQGFRDYEAAEMMGITVDALESLLARARRRLRERLRAIAPQLLGDA